MNTDNNNTKCARYREQLPELLMSDVHEAADDVVALRQHVARCGSCAGELVELQATFALLDEWAAPEPSVYFDTRLHARLREAAAAQPEGWWERTRSFLLFSTGRHLRPALAGAMAVLLLVGGLSFGGLYQHNMMTAMATPSATVNDLRILDNNAQALQQMDQLLDDGVNDESAPPTT